MVRFLLKIFFIFFILFVFPLTFYGQKKVYAEVEVKKISNGKLMTVKKEIYYNANGKMIVRFTHPEESYLITNIFGEAKVYNPKVNEVMLVNDDFFSSKSELLYYFLSNKVDDLGLKSLGYSLHGTKTEGTNIVRTYLPDNPKSNFSKVEMVHENHLPIYCAYYNTKNKITQKIYYSDYQNVSSFFFPSRITEISYIEKDSIISRMIYSNIKIDNKATSPNFDFTIPSNAKIVQDKNMLMPKRPAKK